MSTFSQERAKAKGGLTKKKAKEQAAKMASLEILQATTCSSSETISASLNTTPQASTLLNTTPPLNTTPQASTLLNTTPPLNTTPRASTLLNTTPPMDFTSHEPITCVTLGPAAAASLTTSLSDTDFLPTASPSPIPEVVDTRPVRLPPLLSPTPFGAPSLGYPSGSYTSMPAYKMPLSTYYPASRRHFSPEPTCSYRQEGSPMSDVSSVSQEKKFNVSYTCSIPI